MNSRKIKWGSDTYEFYTPKRNRAKLSVLFGFFVLLLITPATNWLMIPTLKLINKFPLWLYK